MSITLGRTTWRLIKAATSEEEDFNDAVVIKAFNRFANQAKAIILDPDGDKKLTYTKGYLVEVQAHPEGTSPWYTLIGGFVVDTIQRDNELEISILSHDFWLRKRAVFKSYTNEYISDILENLIDDLTPLVWDAGLVTVLNDIQITRTWKGETLDVVIGELANMSGEEEFGAQSDLKFYFNERDTVEADRNFTDGEFYHSEFPEHKQDEANKVTVYYGEGGSTGIVSVQDLVAQQELADKIGASKPVVIEIEANHPEIDNEDAARRKGNSLLALKQYPLIGLLHSWDGFELTPGEVTAVEDVDKNIDGSFRIAQLKYAYLEGTTEVTVAENYDGVIDTLVGLSKEVVRIDMKQADITATKVETVDIPQPYKYAVTVKAYKQTVPDTMFIFGERKGGFGDPAVGGGELGDDRGPMEELL